PGEDPASQGRLEGGDIEAAEEFAEATLGGGLAAGEAEGVGQGLAAVAGELSDGLQAPGARQGGDDGQGKDGGQRVANPAAEPRVGKGSEDLHEGQRLTHDQLLLSLGQEEPYPLSAASPRSTGKQPCTGHVRELFRWRLGRAGARIQVPCRPPLSTFGRR